MKSTAPTTGGSPDDPSSAQLVSRLPRIPLAVLIGWVVGPPRQSGGELIAFEKTVSTLSVERSPLRAKVIKVPDQSLPFWVVSFAMPAGKDALRLPSHKVIDGAHERRREKVAKAPVGQSERLDIVVLDQLENLDHDISWEGVQRVPLASSIDMLKDIWHIDFWLAVWSSEQCRAIITSVDASRVVSRGS